MPVFSGISILSHGVSRRSRPVRRLIALFVLVLLAAGGQAVALAAQTQTSTPPQQQTTNPPDQQTSKPQQQAPAEAGGPQGDVGPIALPKKKAGEQPPETAPKPRKVEGMPEFSMRVDVPVVTVPVTVLTKDGQFIPGLKKDNFRVMEDGVAQNVSGFTQAEAPITAVLLVEFANTNYNFMYDALNASYTFASGLKPDDWVAVVAYDMKPQILADFTQDKRQILAALNTLRIPGFSETNLYDALYDTLDRLDRLEGRKYVILISSGRDTFSKLTYDKILQKVKTTPNVAIYSISTGEAFRMWVDAHYGQYSGVREAMMDYLQADNQMQTFARMTGGRWYKPRFEGELPEIFRDIAAQIRNEYVISYHPSNAKLDGSYRKLKVELVGPDGKPLRVQDQKGKQLKYTIVAREGYTAKHQVE